MAIRVTRLSIRELSHRNFSNQFFLARQLSLIVQKRFEKKKKALLSDVQHIKSNRIVLPLLFREFRSLFPSCFPRTCPKTKKGRLPWLQGTIRPCTCFGIFFLNSQCNSMKNSILLSQLTGSTVPPVFRWTTHRLHHATLPIVKLRHLTGSVRPTCQMPDSNKPPWNLQCRRSEKQHSK